MESRQEQKNRVKERETHNYKEKFREWERKVYLKPSHFQASKPVTAERVRRAFLNPALFSCRSSFFLSLLHTSILNYANEIILEVVKNFHTLSDFLISKDSLNMGKIKSSEKGRMWGKD